MRVMISAYEGAPLYDVRKPEHGDQESSEQVMVEIDQAVFSSVARARAEWKKAEKILSDLFAVREAERQVEWRRKNPESADKVDRMLKGEKVQWNE